MNLDNLNILGLDQEPKRRRSHYNHKEQFKYYVDADSEQFCRTYRFRKQTVETLSEQLDSQIGPKWKTNNAFETYQRLCIALKFYANGCFQQEVGDSEVASQSSVSRIVTNVSKVLASHADTLIKFSVNDRIMQRVSSGFYGTKGS